jgi:IS30 family transposase
MIDCGPRVKNGPALRSDPPEQLRRSLTWDQGAEVAQHAQLRFDSELQAYFCDRRAQAAMQRHLGGAVERQRKLPRKCG